MHGLLKISILAALGCINYWASLRARSSGLVLAELVALALASFWGALAAMECIEALR